MPQNTNQFTFSPLEPLNLNPILRCLLHSPAHPRPRTCQACWFNQPSDLPPSPTLSTIEIADDMSEWLDSMGASADMDISEISCDEDQMLSEIASMLAAGSDNGPRWIENMLGEPIEGEPEYESEVLWENPTESGPEWSESLLGEALQSELEYWSEGPSEHFSESAPGRIGPEWLESLLREPLRTEIEYWPEGLTEYLSEMPTETGLNTGFQGVLYMESGLDDILMGDAPIIPSLTFSGETYITFDPSTAEYDSLNVSLENSNWDPAALMPPITTFVKGSMEMSLPLPPLPPPGLWDEMEGLEFEFEATIPAEVQPMTTLWREEAGDPFIGTGTGDDEYEDEGVGLEFGDGNLTNYYSMDQYGEGRLGRRSRTASLADGSEFGEWIEGSWEDEEVVLAANLWGEEQE